MNSIYLDVLISCIIAYFVCAIPFGLFVAKKEYNVDVRQHGSGNIGSTNVARTAGAKAGFITLLLDSSKSFVCIKLAQLILSYKTGLAFDAFCVTGQYSWLVAWVFFFCILGHIYSPYLKFKGGKGVATGLGATLSFMPLSALVCLVIFLAIVLSCRYVSLASIVSALSLPLSAYLIYQVDIKTLIPLILVSLTIVFAHRQNISRLISGRESKFSFAKK